jgi:hypothetical protein
MITTNEALSRVVPLRFGANDASAFTIEVDGRQYLVTARHAVADPEGGAAVGLDLDGGWEEIGTRSVRHSPDDLDITVISLPRQRH